MTQFEEFLAGVAASLTALIAGGADGPSQPQPPAVIEPADRIPVQRPGDFVPDLAEPPALATPDSDTPADVAADITPLPIPRSPAPVIVAGEILRLPLPRPDPDDPLRLAVAVPAPLAGEAPSHVPSEPAATDPGNPPAPAAASPALAAPAAVPSVAHVATRIAVPSVEFPWWAAPGGTDDGAVPAPAEGLETPGVPALFAAIPDIPDTVDLAFTLPEPPLVVTLLAPAPMLPPDWTAPPPDEDETGDPGLVELAEAEFLPRPSLAVDFVRELRVSRLLPLSRPDYTPPASAATALAAIAAGSSVPDFGDAAVIGTRIAAITEGACGIPVPIDVDMVDGVRLVNGATLNPAVIGALADWLTEDVQPAAMAGWGRHVTEIRVAASYSCRGRNGDPTAPLSEHAFGNAIDISGFRLDDGTWIIVQPFTGTLGADDYVAARFLTAIRGGACGPFTTVLGPGVALHDDHFHLDLARRGRNGQSLYCV